MRRTKIVRYKGVLYHVPRWFTIEDMKKAEELEGNYNG